MKVLYISFYYPPFNTIGGLRSYGQVQALRSVGCEVKVISSAQQGFEKDDFNSYKDLDNEVYFLGEYTNPKGNRFSKNLISLKKLIIHLPRPVNRFIHLIKYLIFGENRDWLNAVKSEYRDILDKWKPDIIFSSQSPISSHKAASFISGEIDVKWIAEFRESHRIK